MELFPMMTRSIAERLALPIATADRLFTALSADLFAALRRPLFPALRQLPRIGDALSGHRNHGEPK
jgi:hypothetical protein